MTFTKLDAVLVKLLSNSGFNVGQISDLYECGETQIADIVHGRKYRDVRSCRLNLTPTGRVTLINATTPN